MIYSKNLENILVKRHIENQSDRLIFLGGYIGPMPILNLINALPRDNSINCDLIYGCYKKANINNIFHKKFMNITSNSPVKIYYKNQYNHSKIYMWLKNNQPIECILGSANFSTSGLCNDYSETLIKANKDDLNTIKNLLENALNDSKVATDNTFDFEKKSLVKQPNISNNLFNLDTVLSIDPPKANIFLGNKPNSVHNKSGLNWGHSLGHVSEGAAYIPIRKNLIDTLPSLFPLKGINPNVGLGQSKKNNKQYADALWDDGTIMKLSFEGIAAPNFFKQITSYPKNNILGLYIRKRLGIKGSEKITYNHLVNYGRANISLSKVDEDNYYIDFSV